MLQFPVTLMYARMGENKPSLLFSNILGYLYFPKDPLFMLTHISLVDYSIRIYKTSPFPILGVSGLLFHLYFYFDRNSCEQTVQTLIRRRVPRRWVCTVCLCPKNRINTRLICMGVASGATGATRSHQYCFEVRHVAPIIPIDNI